MGKAIFQTEIIELGEQVDAFFEEGMFVLFGDNVPDTLKDFCHFIDQKKVDGTIKKGDKLVVDQKEYLITAVGDIAQSNLETLGHLTVVFSGRKKQVFLEVFVLRQSQCQNLRLEVKFLS